MRTISRIRRDSFDLARFDIDATPPVGFMMAYDRVKRVEELGLRCRGIVLLGADDPIVLCAVDWIGIGNESHDVFRRRLARAAATTPDRVAVHTLHQHDAPRSDFSAERLLNAAGATDLGFHEGSFAREMLNRLDAAVQLSMANATPITHAGYGAADVIDVASNRRILGDDGLVRATRYTTCRDPELRAAPDGTIDPQLSCLSFWNNDQPVAVLTYYACHPQSYYRTGIPSPDFPGIARFMRGQDLPNVLHVHFNGAGGNIGAGKYNDGKKENRLILAGRVADGMKGAFEATKKFPLKTTSIGRSSELPVSWSNTEGAGGGGSSNFYVITCQNVPSCSCDPSSAGMVLSGYAECPPGAVLVSAGTPVDDADNGFQANCMYLDGTYADPAYISIRCISLSIEANCSDLVDNDGDSAVDCDDADCANDPACQLIPVENCSDLVDNDGDSAVDCDDADCVNDPACQLVPVENCSDLVDNDGDSAVDCDDADCAERSGVPA